LAAAYELIEAGHDVTVLEARSRPGGRVLTLRDGFADGLYAEAGAIYVPEHHAQTMRYLRLLGVALDPFAPQGGAVYYLEGRRARNTDDDAWQWPQNLRADEQGRDPTDLLVDYLAPALAAVGDSAAPGWPGTALRAYDAVSVADFLRQQGASPAALALLRVGGDLYLQGDGIESLSLLWALRYLHDLLAVQGVYLVRGGADRFPAAFAARLGLRIRYEAPVVRIAPGPDAIAVTCVEGGAPRLLTADYVVCTIPFSVLREIEIAPPFPPAKMQTIRELPYTSVTRVYVQTRTRFWRERGESGYATTDLPLMACADATLGQPGSRGILMSYQAGPQARATAALAPDERVARTLAEMERVFPGVGGQYEWGTSYAWDADPWARGDYSWLRPGQGTTLAPHLGTPEGRVYFAGEHVSPWPGWMQGALWSGARAAQAIVAAADARG
jgi:monoamine oxidase